MSQMGQSRPIQPISLLLDVRFHLKAMIAAGQRNDANGQKQPSSGLLDHLIGAGKQRRRNINTKQSCRLQIDDELEFG